MTNSRLAKPKRRRIIFIVGPTAVGKSRVSVFLAKRFKGEVISCDAMQVYQGMDILTAKPSLNLRKGVPHHLISVVNPAKEYDVARYCRAALSCLEDVFRRGRTPIFCGGTGLYVSILLDGIFKGAPEHKQLRQRLYKEAREHGSACLYRRLRQVDAQAASKIHPHDVKRIVRALEVYLTTGRPISEHQAERKGLADKYEVRVFGLEMARDELYRRINQRVERMFKQGLLKEAEKLLRRKLSKTAGFAIGLRELKDFYRGRYDLAGAKELIKRNTRWYAKRQLTWFKKDPRVNWLNIGKDEKPQSAARRIVRLLNAAG
jgi:tRNA dimethylallyltransferase